MAFYCSCPKFLYTENKDLFIHNLNKNISTINIAECEDPDHIASLGAV